MKTGKELIEDIDKCMPARGSLAFWWLGQIGFVIKLRDTTIYIDPFLSDYPDRKVSSLFKPHELVNADYILGTHDHIDHIDRAVWHELSLNSPNAAFVVPKMLIDSLSIDLKIPHHRFIGLDDGVLYENHGLKISGIASAHEFLDQDMGAGCYP
jgi:L-ascorbate 6-phosphate lactonase